MTSSGIAAVLVLAAATLGCASPRASGRAAPTQALPADAVASASPKPEPDGATLVCENELPTGSHIPRRVCRRTDDMRREREAAQEFLRRPRNNARQGD